MKLYDYSAFAVIALVMIVSSFAFIVYIIGLVLGWVTMFIMNHLTNFLIKWFNRLSYLVIDMFKKFPKITFITRF